MIEFRTYALGEVGPIDVTVLSKLFEVGLNIVPPFNVLVLIADES